ncbi:hypothetical protein GCM10022262_37940 [Georgenia daeguensis]|uniref:Uncharacterized protein n=1 Tax=Georgenia daeguensis TaxID=908355 RepID=A0ABP6UKL3_9MICO
MRGRDPAWVVWMRSVLRSMDSRPSSRRGPPRRGGGVVVVRMSATRGGCPAVVTGGTGLAGSPGRWILKMSGGTSATIAATWSTTRTCLAEEPEGPGTPDGEG